MAFGTQTWTFNPACLSAQPVEVDANLMTTENPNESGSKASCRDKGASSLTRALSLLPACLLLPHSSFVSATHAFRRWHLPPQSLAFSVFLVHQVSFLHVTYVDLALAAQRTFVIMSDTLSNSLLYACSSAGCDLCFCMFLMVCDRFYCMNGHFDSFLWF